MLDQYYIITVKELEWISSITNTSVSWFNTAISQWYTNISSWFTGLMVWFRRKLKLTIQTNVTIYFTWKTLEHISRTGSFREALLGIFKIPVFVLAGYVLGEVADGLVPLPSTKPVPLIPPVYIPKPNITPPLVPSVPKPEIRHPTTLYERKIEKYSILKPVIYSGYRVYTTPKHTVFGMLAPSISKQWYIAIQGYSKLQPTLNRDIKWGVPTKTTITPSISREYSLEPVAPSCIASPISPSSVEQLLGESFTELYTFCDTSELNNFDNYNNVTVENYTLVINDPSLIDGYIYKAYTQNIKRIAFVTRTSDPDLSDSEGLFSRTETSQHGGQGVMTCQYGCYFFYGDSCLGGVYASTIDCGTWYLVVVDYEHLEARIYDKSLNLIDQTDIDVDNPQNLKIIIRDTSKTKEVKIDWIGVII